MAAPTQMFTNTLDAIKGWFHEAALDHSAEIAGSQTDGTNDLEYKQGMCCSLNADNKLVLGCEAANVAIFLLNSEDDPDVANVSFGGNHLHTASGDWIAVGPSGKLSGLVATGGYEFETTEYLTADAYAVGAPLKSRISGNAHAGKLQGGFAYTDAIVGVVSKKQLAGSSANKNSHGQPVLRFWSVWLPQSNVANISAVIVNA